MHRLKTLIALVGLLLIGNASAEDFLDPAIAFKPSLRLQNPQTLLLRYDIAPGYYLYRDALKFRLKPGNTSLSLGVPTFPPGKTKEDPNFGKVQVYTRSVEVVLPLKRPDADTAQTLTLNVTAQGCAEAGLCYPPQTQTLTIALPPLILAEPANPTPPPPPSPEALDETGQIAQLLSGSSFWAVLLFFAVAGLGLSLTPCILPMIPILSGIIVGTGTAPTRWQSFRLSLAYVLGMALTYTAAGIAAGLTGTLLSTALQNVWVLGSFALIFVVLALSMFGLYELQLPLALQNRLTQTTGKLPGGRVTGLFVMGALSALIVGPCVAAPLAGALLYIGKTGDALLGGLALFVMALGMGVPLLLVGVSAGQFLPKTGAWMVWIKRGFGVLLLATAVWLVYPVLPALNGEAPGTRQHQSVLPFTRVHNVAELDAQLKTGQPVMLDFYADWCTSCLEMERLTFTDRRVQAALGNFRLLQVDVTANTPEDQALLKRFELFGPPAILFFDKQGHETRSARVVGYLPPEAFLARLPDRR